MGTKNILVAGPVYIDTIYAGLPREPEIGKEVFCSDFRISIGAMGITSIGLARLGMSVRFITAIGDDFQGDFIKKKLVRENINVDNIITVNGKSTNSSMAMVYKGDRGFVSYRGANINESNLLKGLLNNKQILGNINYLHTSISSDSSLASILKKIKKHNIIISLVTGWEGAKKYGKDKKGLYEILKYTDIFFCNELEAKTLTGEDEIRESVLQLNEKTTPVVTLGSEGAVTTNENESIIKAEALDVNFIDPTGAGDSFIAGYLSGLNKNWNQQRCLKLGTVCGSLSTRATGGITSFPKNLKEAEKYIAEGD